jgi:RNA polymerase-binding transcription factor DksA
MTTLAYRIDTSPSPEDLTTHVPALRAALEEQLRFRTEQLAELANAARDGGALSVDDARYEVADVIRAGASVALSEIDDALERVRDGSYGSCEDCKGRIPLERLEILPMARHCMRCQQHREARRL